MSRNWIRIATVKPLLIAITFFLLIGSTSFADEINIPFAVNMKEFKWDLKQHGLNFYGDKKAIGFIEDKGSRIVLYTYKRIKTEDMETIKNVMWKHVRK